MIEKVLEPYRESWSEWIINVACPFNEREIFAFESYRRYYSHRPASEELNITTSRVSYLYNRVLWRLRSEQYQKKYQEWKTDMMLIDLGINKYENELEEFLEMPINDHRLPSHLHFCLGMCGETINEILREETERTMLQKRGFGKKSLAKFKEMLVEKGCIDLLKK